MLLFFKKHGLYFAWLIALSCLVGSLYSSEIADLPVCKLCWFQRITLYPLAIILGIAAYREDRTIYVYALPLALLGALIALYQYLLQRLPELFPIHLCDRGPSCYTESIQWLGFITYPLLSLAGAALIALFLWLAKSSKSQ